jgi:hypothetical protein
VRLIALEIPDDQARLPGWLEEQLLSFDLAALVAELEAVHPPARGAGTPLGDILGQNRGAVLEKGLSALPPARLRQLLRQPRLLLDLQELILVEGGEYWRKTIREDRESRQLVDRGWSRLDAFLRSGSADVGTSRAAASRIPWYRRSWVVSLATAAALLAGVFAYEWSRPPAGWGWSRPGALRQDLSTRAYFNLLANEADEWFTKRPEQPAPLARRISELRQGCSALILAEHQNLSSEDRHWLVRTCMEWAGQLDRRLGELESGDDPLKVRARVDDTVREISQKLRTRAAERA